MATQPRESKPTPATESTGPGAEESAPSSPRAKPKGKQKPSRSAREVGRAQRQSEALNFIRAEPLRTQIPKPVPARGGAQTPAAGDGNAFLRPSLDEESVPQAVRQRYVQDRHQYYLPSGDHAFADHGLRLTTRTENTTIIRDLVAIAVARGWQDVTIGGTKAFRQEGWREAKLAGLEVSNYKPSRLEQAILIRLLTQRQERGAALQEPTPRPGARDEREAPAEKAEGSARAPRTDQASLREGALITGRLLDHRADHRYHDPEEPLSYFVRIKPGRGKEDIEIWGRDLQRAIRQSLTDVQIGDDIGLRAVERKESANPNAAEVEPENRWIVEQRRFFNDRAQLAKVFRDTDTRPSDAYRHHPELKGSYLKLQATKLRIEESVKNPEDRAEILGRLREGMAAAMERGEPLTPVRMRDRSAAKEPKTASIADSEQLFTR